MRCKHESIIWRAKVSCAGKAMGAAIGADHEIAAIVSLAADEDMDVRVIRVPMFGGDPIEPGPKVSLHVGKEIAGERFEIDHLGRLFRADDKQEVMAVIPAASAQSLWGSKILAFSPSRVTPSRLR